MGVLSGGVCLRILVSGTISRAGNDSHKTKHIYISACVECSCVREHTLPHTDAHIPHSKYLPPQTQLDKAISLDKSVNYLSQEGRSHRPLCVV